MTTEGTTKLYVGNLGREMTDQQLYDLFGRMGTVVSARVLTHARTGKSRGFGHVEMATGAQARRAITSLHRSPVAGLALIVYEAIPWQSRRAASLSRWEENEEAK